MESKTTVMMLPDRQRSLTISSTAWIQSTNVTDGQTDGWMDTGPQQRPRLRIASRGKNSTNCLRVLRYATVRQRWSYVRMVLSLSIISSVDYLIEICAQLLEFNEKSAKRDAKHCALAEPKNFAPPQTPFPGTQDGQNLISWRWSLPLPINPVWWRSMHAISSYRGNRPTNEQ